MLITHNTVPMTKRRKGLMDAANFYARYLKISNYDVTVQIVFKYLLTETFSIYGQVNHVSTNRLKIDFDAKIPYELGMQKLAHEMVHVKQYIKGQLAEDSKGFQLWKGAQVDADLPYHKQPWEVEAMKKEVLMMSAFVAWRDKK